MLSPMAPGRGEALCDRGQPQAVRTEGKMGLVELGRDQRRGSV
jgi:hypothetical protein